MSASLSEAEQRGEETAGLTATVLSRYPSSAMALKIPEHDVPAVSSMRGLSAHAIEELIAAINSAPLDTDLGALAKRIAPKIRSISADRLGKFIDALYTLYYIRELSSAPHEIFLDDLIEAIQNNQKLAVAKKDVGKFRQRMNRLLEIEAFNTIAKAGRLQRQGEHLYCNSRILSDIRPVFGSRPTQRPLGAVITHSLRLGYHEGSEHKEFFVILDSDDLVAINEVVARALAKDKTLREFLADAKLPDLGE